MLPAIIGPFHFESPNSYLEFLILMCSICFYSCPNILNCQTGFNNYFHFKENIGTVRNSFGTDNFWVYN